MALKPRVRPTDGAHVKDRPFHLPESSRVLRWRHADINWNLQTYPLPSKLTKLYHAAWEGELHIAGGS